MNDVMENNAPVAPRRNQPLRVPKAPEIVAQRIRKDIVGGKLLAGEVLPSEARLMEEFGVSRPTIREAFRILEAEHLITVARGARGGAVIHAPDPELISAYTLLVLQAERTTVDEIFSTRRLVEPAVAREVALKASRTAPAILRQCIAEELATQDDVPAFAKAIATFHRTLVELSGNRPLIHLIQAITSVIESHQAMAMRIARRGVANEEIRKQLDRAFKSQKKLADLIEQRDADGAEAHWRKHMDASQKAWIMTFEDLTIHRLIGE
jgi:DNA-binding FadR family transcriptional regulator